MKGSKLISLFSKCEAQELKLFEKYISSPYFNTNDALFRMTKILRNAAPTFKEKRINKEVIFKEIFPNTDYSEKRISNLMSELVKHIENFWAAENYKTHRVENKIKLARNYFDHDLEHLGEQNLVSAEKELYKSKPNATMLYERLLDINTVKHEVIESREVRNVEPNLQAIHNHLDAYYIVSKLKYYYKCLNFSGMTDHKYELDMIDSVMTEAKRVKFLPYDAIQIYYHAVKTLLSFDNDEDFIALKQLLIENSHKYAADEVTDMILTARNFAIRRLNRGESEYAAEALDLYKLEISENLLVVEDAISNVATRNMVQLALITNDTEWALGFLSSHKRFISHETFTFCKASVKFDRGEFEEVLNLLAKTSFRDPLLNLSVRTLKLQIHFEKFFQNRSNYVFEDALEEYINEFRKHFSISGEDLTARASFYSTLLEYTDRIFIELKKDKLDSKNIKKIKDELSNEKQVAQKNWITEKIQSLV